MEVAMALWDAAEDFPNRTLTMMDPRKMHGEEPADLVAAAMQQADVIFRVTKMSLTHTMARKKACQAGARDLNCCDYTMSMLESGGLYTDFEANRKFVDQIAKGFENGSECRIISDKGTDYTASIKGHKVSPQYGMSTRKGEFSSPPDIECATGAIPFTANGTIVVDGSITHPEIGVLKEPITLEIKDSIVQEIKGGKEAEKFRKVLEEFHDPRVYQVGEIGVGLNPDASLCGRMLEDEGCYGYVHVALGNNDTNLQDCPFHIDMMFQSPTIFVDEKVILDKGNVVFD